MFDISNSMPQATEKLFVSMSNFKEINDFTLVGGTALAIHIKHRTSKDLIFFINKNSINTALQHKIDDLHAQLEEMGYIVSETGIMDEYQQDYNISGVKVTYHVINSTDLKRDVVQYGNIDIASKDSIAAMKIYTILKHRIKSRDFYDVKYLMEKEKFTFNDLLSRLQTYFPKYKVSAKKVETRFLKTDLNLDDEGFESLELQQQESFSTLREYFKGVFYDALNTECILMKEIAENENLIEPNLGRRLGLDNKTLLMKLFEYKNIKGFCFALGCQDYALLDKDIQGRTVFNYLAESNELSLFDDTLMRINFIPEGLPEQINVLGNSKDLIEIIEIHKVLNRSAKKESDVAMKLIKKSSFPVDMMNEKLDIKRRYLDLNINRNIYLSIKNNEEVPSSEFSKIDFESESFNSLDDDVKEVITEYVTARSDAITEKALEKEKQQNTSTDLNV